MSAINQAPGSAKACEAPKCYQWLYVITAHVGNVLWVQEDNCNLTVICVGISPPSALPCRRKASSQACDNTRLTVLRLDYVTVLTRTLKLAVEAFDAGVLMLR